MSQRPGLYARATAPSPKPPWANPDLPDPRSQVPAITVEVRAHWPYWADREQVRAALDAAYGDAINQLHQTAKEDA